MPAEAQRYVRLVGLEVRDDALYRQYREHMSPILRSYGGSFGYDFVVARVLESQTPAPINRVFTIRFPTRDAAQRFFSDTAYLAVRARYFEPAVGGITNIAAYDENS
jgi:uncharacterized protein (DUF1330 family)